MKTVPRYLLVPLSVLLATLAIWHAVQPRTVGGAYAATDVNVRAYGAKGDGQTDDTAAFVKASRAAVRSHRRLFVPAGTYRLGQLALPDGLTMRGASRRSAWLRGHVDFGSHDVIRDLKIGDAGNSAVCNRAGATNTLFKRCRFRGGGGTAGGESAPVVFLGGSKACSFITFTACEVECSLGTENASFDNGYNCITVMSIGAGTVSHVTFDRCHVGVSNGVRSGSLRMGIECFTEVGAAGWDHVTLTGCVFEAMDSHGLDFSDQPAGRSTDVLIDGCTIYGGGVAQHTLGDSICFEFPKGAVLRNSTVYRGWYRTVHCDDRGTGAYGSAAVTITGNRFPLDVDTIGCTPTAAPFKLFMDGNAFTNNVITQNFGSTCIDLDACHANIVTGNTATLGGRSLVREYEGSSGNTISRNTVD